MDNLAHKFVCMILEFFLDFQGFVELWIAFCRQAARAAT